MMFREVCAVLALLGGSWWGVTHLPPGDWAALAGLVPGGWAPGPFLLSNAARSLSSLALALLLLLLYDSSGVRLLRWITGRRPTGALRLSAPFLGYCLAGVATLGGACSGLWYPAALLAGMLAAFAWALPEIPAVVRGWARYCGEAWGGSAVPARAAYLFLACWWVFLLAPPELAVDCLEYHLAYPEQMLATHRLIGRDVYLGCPLPLCADFPNVFPVMAGLDTAARLLRPVLAGVGALALLRGLALPLARSWEPALVCLALLVPYGRSFSVFAKSDGIIAGAVLALAGVLLQSGVLDRVVRSRTALLVAGLLAGFAASSKYVTIPLLAFVALFSLARLPRRERLRAAFPALAAALVPLVPWMGRSFVFFADPLYPAGSVWLPGLFGEPAWNGATAEAYRIFIAETRMRGDFLRETVAFALRDGFPFLAGALLLRGRRVPGFYAVTLALLGGMAALVLSFRGAGDFVERYSYPAQIGLCVAGLGAFLSFARRSLAVPAAIAVLAVFGAMLTASHLAMFPGASPADYALGRVSAADFRVRGMYAYGAVLPAIRRACAGARDGAALVTLGNRLMPDIPVRVVGEGFEPPFIWKAVRESGSAERLAIRFRQRGVRWILYNNPLAGWNRFIESPWAWDDRMLRLWDGFVRRRLRLLASSGRCDPLYGCNWFYGVADRDGPAPRRILFLPGAERALTFASLARAAGAARESAVRFDSVRRRLPGVAWFDALYGEALGASGDWAGAYRMVRGAVDFGLLDESCLFTMAEASAHTGRRAEAGEWLARARLAYPLWPERLAQARRRLEGGESAGGASGPAKRIQ